MSSSNIINLGNGEKNDIVHKLNMLNEDIDSLKTKISDAEIEINLKDREIELHKQHSFLLKNYKPKSVM